MSLEVRSQVTGLSEPLSAILTLIRLFPTMSSHMRPQVEIQRKPPFAILTLVGSLALSSPHRVHKHVPFQLRPVSKVLAAVLNRTLELHLPALPLHPRPRTGGRALRTGQGVEGLEVLGEVEARLEGTQQLEEVSGRLRVGGREGREVFPGDCVGI